MRSALFLILAIGLAGCNYRHMKPKGQPGEPQSGNPGPERVVTYDMVREKVFAPLCIECHNPDMARAGLDLTTHDAAMAAVTRGNPGESLVYNMVEWEEMPPKRRMPPLRLLTAEEKDLVKAWIEGGAN
jgi:hypothetical protein